ncbi:MAG: hypothetical protein K0R12_1183 [Gammaproteobacteria bacterium]|nr:hypothetical protein [Gammaproteobacteria bacterium]
MAGDLKNKLEAIDEHLKIADDTREAALAGLAGSPEQQVVAERYLKRNNTLAAILREEQNARVYLEASDLITTPTAYSEENKKEIIEKLEKRLEEAYATLIREQQAQEAQIQTLIQKAFDAREADKAREFQEILVAQRQIHQLEREGLREKLLALPAAFKEQAQITREIPTAEYIKKKFYIVEENAARTTITSTGEKHDPAYISNLTISGAITQPPVVRAFASLRIPQKEVLKAPTADSTKIYYQRTPAINEAENSGMVAEKELNTADYRIELKADGTFKIVLQNPPQFFLADLRRKWMFQEAMKDLYKIALASEQNKGDLKIDMQLSHLGESMEKALSEHNKALSKEYGVATTGVAFDPAEAGKERREKAIKKGELQDLADEKASTARDEIVKTATMKMLKGRFNAHLADLKSHLYKNGADPISVKDKEAIDHLIENLTNDAGLSNEHQQLLLSPPHNLTDYNSLIILLTKIAELLAKPELFPEQNFKNVVDHVLVEKRCEAIHSLNEQLALMLHGIPLTNNPLEVGENKPLIENLSTTDDQITALVARQSHSETEFQGDLAKIVNKASTDREQPEIKDKANKITLYKVLQNLAVEMGSGNNLQKEAHQKLFETILKRVLNDPKVIEFITDWQSDIHLEKLLNQLYDFLLKNENKPLVEQLIAKQPTLKDQLIAYAAGQPEKYKDMSPEIKQGIREYVKDKAVLRHQLLAKTLDVGIANDIAAHAELMKAAVVTFRGNSEEKRRFIMAELSFIHDPTKVKTIGEKLKDDVEIDLSAADKRSLNEDYLVNNESINAITVLPAGIDRVVGKVGGPQGFFELYAAAADDDARRPLRERFYQIEWTRDELIFFAEKLNGVVDIAKSDGAQAVAQANVKHLRQEILLSASPAQAAILISRGLAGQAISADNDWRTPNSRLEDLENIMRNDSARAAAVFVEIYHYHKANAATVEDVCEKLLTFNGGLAYLFFDKEEFRTALLQHPNAEPVLLARFLDRYVDIRTIAGDDANTIQTALITMLKQIPNDNSHAGVANLSKRATVFAHLDAAMQTSLVKDKFNDIDQDLRNAILALPRDKVNNASLGGHCNACVSILWMLAGLICPNINTPDQQLTRATEFINIFKEKVDQNKWVEMYIAAVKSCIGIVDANEQATYQNIINHHEFIQTIFKEDNTLFENLLNLPEAEVTYVTKAGILMAIKLDFSHDSTPEEERAEFLCEQLAKVDQSDIPKRASKASLITAILNYGGMAVGPEQRKAFLKELTSSSSINQLVELCSINNLFAQALRTTILSELSDSVSLDVKAKIIAGIAAPDQRNVAIQARIGEAAPAAATDEQKKLAKEILLALTGENRKAYFKSLLGNPVNTTVAAKVFWQNPDLMKLGDVWDLASTENAVGHDDPDNRAAAFAALVEEASLDDDQQFNYLVDLYFHLNTQTREQLINVPNARLGFDNPALKWTNLRNMIIKCKQINQLQASGAEKANDDRRNKPPASSMLSQLFSSKNRVIEVIQLPADGDYHEAVTEGNLKTAKIHAIVDLINSHPVIDEKNALFKVFACSLDVNSEEFWALWEKLELHTDISADNPKIQLAADLIVHVYKETKVNLYGVHNGHTYVHADVKAAGAPNLLEIALTAKGFTPGMDEPMGFFARFSPFT